MLRLLLDSLPAGKKDFTAAHIDSLAALCMGSGDAQLDLPHGVRARRRSGQLVLTIRGGKAPGPVPLPIDERTAWGEYTITARNAGKNRVSAGSTFCLRCDAGKDVLSVGAWNARAWLTLPGKTPRSLKRLFADAGVAASERDGSPVVFINGAAAAVYGIGADEAFLPDADEDAVVIEIQRNHK